MFLPNPVMVDIRLYRRSMHVYYSFTAVLLIFCSTDLGEVSSRLLGGGEEVWANPALAALFAYQVYNSIREPRDEACVCGSLVSALGIAACPVCSSSAIGSCENCDVARDPAAQERRGGRMRHPGDSAPEQTEDDLCSPPEFAACPSLKGLSSLPSIPAPLSLRGLCMGCHRLPRMDSPAPGSGNGACLCAYREAAAAALPTAPVLPLQQCRERFLARHRTFSSKLGPATPQAPVPASLVLGSLDSYYTPPFRALFLPFSRSSSPRESTHGLSSPRASPPLSPAADAGPITETSASFTAGLPYSPPCSLATYLQASPRDGCWRGAPKPMPTAGPFEFNYSPELPASSGTLGISHSGDSGECVGPMCSSDLFTHNFFYSPATNVEPAFPPDFPATHSASTVGPLYRPRKRGRTDLKIAETPPRTLEARGGMRGARGGRPRSINRRGRGDYSHGGLVRTCRGGRRGRGGERRWEGGRRGMGGRGGGRRGGGGFQEDKWTRSGSSSDGGAARPRRRTRGDESCDDQQTDAKRPCRRGEEQFKIEDERWVDGEEEGADAGEYAGTICRRRAARCNDAGWRGGRSPSIS